MLISRSSEAPAVVTCADDVVAQLANHLQHPEHRYRERLQAYVALIQDYNQRFNLVSRRMLAETLNIQTADNFWHRHIYDCAQLVPHLLASLSAHRRPIVDIGSGAGLPGLVLAMFDLKDIYLIESNGKKAEFLRLAAASLGIQDQVHVVQERLEQWATTSPAHKNKPYIFVSRAAASVADLLMWSAPLLSKGSEWWLLKSAGTDHKSRQMAEDELTVARQKWHNKSIELLGSATSTTGRLIHLGAS